MIHLLIAFLLLIFMSLMVVEPVQTGRLLYFFICVILFAIYNVVHLKGLQMSLEMLSRKKTIQRPKNTKYLNKF